MAECAGRSAPLAVLTPATASLSQIRRGEQKLQAEVGPRRHRGNKEIDHCTHLEGGPAPNGQHNSVLFLVCLVCCCCPELRWSSHLLRVLSLDPRRLLVSSVEPMEEQQQKARGSLKHEAGRWSGGWQAVGWQCGLAQEQLVTQHLQGGNRKIWWGKQHCGRPPESSTRVIPRRWTSLIRSFCSQL